jgi:hypothetical protein
LIENLLRCVDNGALLKTRWIISWLRLPRRDRRRAFTKQYAAQRGASWRIAGEEGRAIRLTGYPHTTRQANAPLDPDGKGNSLPADTTARDAAIVEEIGIAPK